MATPSPRTVRRAGKRTTSKVARSQSRARASAEARPSASGAASSSTTRRAKAPKIALRVPLDQARTLWCARQGLLDPSPPARPPEELVARTGWLRTLGGVDVYLAARARDPAMTRAALDDAVARGALKVIPAVRGCIYLVPAGDVAAALSLAAALARPRNERDIERAGATWQEVETLADALEEVLARAPLSTSALRSALPQGAIRSLGARGKKVGLSSPLPVALRELEFRGVIERTLATTRLDAERYVWRTIAPDVRPELQRGPLEQLVAALLTRVLECFAPITTQELSAWIGVPQRVISAALASLPVVTVEIEGHARAAWLLERDLDALRESRPPSPSQRGVRALPYADNLLSVHGGPAVHVDAAHHGRPVKTWGGRGEVVALGAARHLGYRPLLLGERVVGLWEYDARARRVVTALFDGAAPRGSKKALSDLCQQTATFLERELGHARSFSLDTDAAVQDRADALRQQ